MVESPPPAPDLQEPTPDDAPPASARVSLTAGVVAVVLVAVFDPAFHVFVSFPLAAVAIVSGSRRPRTRVAMMGLTLGCLVILVSLVELVR